MSLIDLDMGFGAAPKPAAPAAAPAADAFAMFGSTAAHGAPQTIPANVAAAVNVAAATRNYAVKPRLGTAQNSTTKIFNLIHLTVVELQSTRLSERCRDL